MTFEQLRYFCEIVECGSINVAAQRCFISYTAMSKSLKNLEKELGFRLVNRNHAGIFLTEDGKSFHNDAVLIMSMQKKWENIANKNTQKLPQKLRVYATYFYTNYVFQQLVPLLKQNNYLFEYYPCLFEMIEPLLLSATNKSNTIAFSSRFPKQPNIEPFAKAHGYEIQHLFTDGFLAYFNRDWFEQTYGTDTTSIDAKELLHMSYIKDVAATNILPYYSLFNPEQPFHLTNIDADIYSYLKEEKTFAFINASQKETIEQLHPYVKGIYVENPPEPLKIDYYFLYPSKMERENLPLIVLIKEFFEQQFEPDYS